MPREIQMWKGLLLLALKIQIATLWRGSCGREMQAAPGSRTPQSYNPKEVNAANSHTTLEGDPLAPNEMQALGWHLAWDPSWASRWTTETELINKCCFKLLSLLCSEREKTSTKYVMYQLPVLQKWINTIPLSKELNSLMETENLKDKFKGKELSWN